MFHAHLVPRGHFTYRSVPITVQFRGIAAGRLCYAEHTSGLLATPDASVAAEAFICHPDRRTGANKTDAFHGALATRGPLPVHWPVRQGAACNIYCFWAGQKGRTECDFLVPNAVKVPWGEADGGLCSHHPAAADATQETAAASHHR